MKKQLRYRISSLAMSFKLADIGLVFLVLLFTACTNHSKDQKAALSERDRQKLTNDLHQIYIDDQKSREKVSIYIEKYGIKSVEVANLGKEIARNDSANLIVVKRIIKKYGWLSADLVGERGNMALFLVIQHATKSDRKYFLPLMRAAVKNHAASAKDLAFLEDRVAEEEGKTQIYGTQIGFDEKTNKYYILPIDNPNQVDQRRAKVGLPPLSVQRSEWQIEPN